LRVGDGLTPGVTMGPLTTAHQRDRAERLVADARQRGARVLFGGARPAHLNRGFFFEPTVMTDTPADAEVLNEEPFAPIAPIVPVASTNEAIDKANALEMGLAAYVFTQSLSSSNFVCEALQAGVVGVNTCAVALPEAPFGGIKQSGYGREGGASAIYDYLNAVRLAAAVEGVFAVEGGTSADELEQALRRAHAHKGLSLVHVPVYFGPDVGAYGRWNVGAWCVEAEAAYHEAAI
jgi:acyl-CoA reductase-like NAD-dependent aldehyde dehydrogenase